jgi:hypothetical protein
MESDGCSPLRIFPQAAIISDVFIKILSGDGPKRSRMPTAGSALEMVDLQTVMQARARRPKTFAGYMAWN